MIRRIEFLAGGIAALAVGSAPARARAAGPAPVADASGAWARLSAWIRVGADGGVDVFTGKVEIGMGVITGFAQIVAEELDVPLARIRMTTGDTDATPDQGGVGGSTSTQLGAQPLRNAAAAARALLVGAAADRWSVAPATLVVRDGVVTDPADAGRAIAYGALVDVLARGAPLMLSGEGFGLDVHGAGQPKARAAYTLVGKPVARLDVAPKVFGEFRFAGDVRVAGMVHARVVRPPAAGARIVTVDERSIARGFGDARSVRIGDFLAVVATREWDAVGAARALGVHWSASPATFPPAARLAATMWTQPPASSDTPHVTGAGATVFADVAGGDVVTAEYAWPFQAHATMGPGCAVADVGADRATVWCGAQKPHALRDGIADLLGLPAARVRVVFVEDAGSYGRSGFDDAAADAALLSRAVGAPVRVQWMRADMTQWGPKAPAIVARAHGLVRDGAIVALDLHVRGFNGGEISSHPDSAGNFIGGQLAGHANTKPRIEYATYGKNSAAYAIANVNATSDLVAPLAPLGSPLRTTHMRDPEGPGTTFAVESFIDELAARAGADPIAFRIRHLPDSRHAEVLRTLAERADWHAGPAARAIADGAIVHGRGVAFATRGETVVATVADVRVDRRTGVVRVTRLVCAHDCGFMVNPRSVRGTIEANLMQSLSRALIEEVRFDATSVTSVDWRTYPVLRTPDVPDRVDIVMIDRPDLPAYGAGEPSSRPTAAAIANAIYDATGRRVRGAPFTPARVLAALRAS